MLAEVTIGSIYAFYYIRNFQLFGYFLMLASYAAAGIYTYYFQITRGVKVIE